MHNINIHVFSKETRKHNLKKQIYREKDKQNP